MWAPVDKDQQDLARAFVTDLETHLGLKTSASSFQQQWKKSPPENAGASSLDDYMNEVDNLHLTLWPLYTF
jgi:hypothetical protein